MVKDITKRLPVVLLSLLLIPSLIFNFLYYQKDKKVRQDNTVTSVVDGDTFVLTTGQRIRLSNIYAPELELCGGKEAKERLEDLVLNKEVRIETSNEDVFNRALGLVYVKDTLVNEALLKDGFVRYDGTPNPKRDVLKAAYDLAVKEKRGLHGPPCRAFEPDNPECLIKANIERASGEKWYYYPGCQSYPQVMVEKDLGESWFCTEKEAQKAGFNKGTSCAGRVYK